MKQHKFSARRRQMLAAGSVGAGVMVVPAAPGVVAAAHQPLVQQAGGKRIVSGRVVSAQDGQALAGAHIEIWQADARGARVESTYELITADGDGRYFATLATEEPRLVYRVSHDGYSACIAQLNSSRPQRSVSLTRDDAGVTRAAFEMKLTPRGASARGVPDIAVL